MKQYTNTGVSRSAKVYLVAEHADRDELPEDLMTKCQLAEIAKRTDEGGGHRIFQEHQHDDAEAYAERIVLAGLAMRCIMNMAHTENTYHQVDGVVTITVDARGKTLDSYFVANRGNKQRHMAAEWAKKNVTQKVAGEDSMNAIASLVTFCDLFTDSELSVPEGFELNEWREYLCAKLPPAPKDYDGLDRDTYYNSVRATWLAAFGIGEESKANIATAEKWLNAKKPKSACPVCGQVAGGGKAERLMHLRAGCGDTVKDHFVNVSFIGDKDKGKKK